MTVEEYRQRLIQAFHDTDCDHYIALVCLPNERAFKGLESMLRCSKEDTSDGKIFNKEVFK